jgi:hypothetical protein
MAYVMLSAGSAPPFPALRNEMAANEAIGHVSKNKQKKGDGADWGG